MTATRRPPGVPATFSRMIRLLRLERVDLLIPLIFSVIAGILSDLGLRKSLEVLSSEWAAAYLAFRPEDRPWVVGGLVAAGFWVFVLRPYWIRARGELRAERLKNSDLGRCMS
jgi:hypothetical protein